MTILLRQFDTLDSIWIIRRSHPTSSFAASTTSESEESCEQRAESGASAGNSPEMDVFGINP